MTRLSFEEGTRAAELLTSPPLSWWDAAANKPVDDSAAVVVAALGRTADPDAALATLAEIAAQPDGAGVRSAVQSEPALRARLLALLGVSTELGAHLVACADDWRVLLDDLDVAGARSRLAAAVGADADDPVTGTAGTRAARPESDALRDLRSAYRRELVAVAGRDLVGDLDLQDVTEILADLAGGVVQAALAVAAARVPHDAAGCRLAVVAMGKTGGRELNYISDVDVVFVAEPVDGEDTDAALATATKLAGDTMRICRQVAWEVDANLRPEGKDGALVRTLASHRAYYERWAKTWEFQALLKARPVAGDPELGDAYRQAIAPLVWAAAERPDFVADVRSMRRRVLEHIPVTVGERDIKLGRGGLRDVEFAVQLLQLVHGRADETLRTPETLPALAALRDGGYVGRDDAVSLIDAYRFLRATEHRLQLRRLRRTHVLPAEPDQLLWLGRALGYRPDRRGDARAVFEAEWSLHAREVRRLHEKLFYRPLLEAVARVPSEHLRLTPEEAGRRLAALGFTDERAALRHIESLTAGISRRAALQRTLLPVLLSDFADAPDPDAGLLAYRRLSDELGSTPWFLRLLRDGDAVASRLAHVLGTSPLREPHARPLAGGPSVAGVDGRPPAARGRLAARGHGRVGPAAARPVGGGGGGPRTSSSGVAADGLRRSPRTDRRRNGVPRAQRHHGRNPRRWPCRSPDAPSRPTRRWPTCPSPSRSSRWVAWAVRRSATAPTPTSCSSSSRGRPTRTRRTGSQPNSPAGSGRCSPLRPRPIRRSWSTRIFGPRVATDPSFGPSSRIAGTTRDGPRRGRPKPCCGHGTSPATPVSASGSSR